MQATHYDLLGLRPGASETDIHAAHIRLVRHYQYGPHGLPPEEAELVVKRIKEAWWTLSDPGRRAVYDAGLRQAYVAPPLSEMPLQVEIRAPSWTPARVMLTIIGGLMIVGMLIQILFSIFAFRHVSGSGEAASAAQERAMAAERRQTYGTLSDAEIAAQEDRARQEREESVSREEERRAEYLQKDEERRREQALQERKRYADQVSADLQHAEEAARQKAEWEKNERETRERREAEQEQSQVQQRLARERERWRQELRN